jgi:hypothetical protein
MFMLVQLSMENPGAILCSMSSMWGRSSALKTGGTWGAAVCSWVVCKGGLYTALGGATAAAPGAGPVLAKVLLAPRWVRYWCCLPWTEQPHARARCG